MKRRAGGILLHITSLPSRFGLGDLGPAARRFVDFLAESGQTYWQILPLNPTELIHRGSPYNSTSAFAGNPWLISLEEIVDMGLLAGTDLENVSFPDGPVDYPAAVNYRLNLLDRAFERFDVRDRYFMDYCGTNARWLDDFALFTALRRHFGGMVWRDWPEEFRDRRPDSLSGLPVELKETVGRVRFQQYLFDRQWKSLRAYCQSKGIILIGDLPIYVDYDSADVWANPEFFKLDETRRPRFVSGVPPDYFSETGQRWGNPVYDWEAIRRSGFSWWVKRFKRTMDLVDFVRIDHFRGLVSYWEVDAHEETAMNGRWVEAPCHELFDRLVRYFPCLPVIAEDLGVITPDVRETIRHLEFPGMKVLLFAFGDDVARNPFAPHNHELNAVVYTGTHDNNTTRGWFLREASEHAKYNLKRYLGRESDPDTVHWDLIRLAMGSVANTTILPMQDVLGLDQDARMNRPGSKEGNWLWRLREVDLNPAVAARLKEITEIYGRT
jgi:4-alpha-glucanotransferase